MKNTILDVMKCCVLERNICVCDEIILDRHVIALSHWASEE